MRRREGERGRLRKGGTKPEKKNREEQRKVLKGRKEKESNAGGRQGKIRVKAFGRKAEQGFLGMLGGIFLAVSVTLLPAGRKVRDGRRLCSGFPGDSVLREGVIFCGTSQPEPFRNIGRDFACPG